MKIRNPYKNLPHWFRGNTHTHSTRSDGDSPLERVVDHYRERGYSFLAMTDHELLLDLAEFAGADFVGIPAEEVTVRGRDHIVGLGLRDPVAGCNTHHQRVIDDIAGQGGLAVLAHPVFSGLSPEQAQGLHGYHAVEILNAVCQYLEYNGYALQWWDELLRRGLQVWGIAADDAHRIAWQAAKAWIMVNAEALTPQHILAGIRTGNFYASTGANFHRFAVEGKTIRVWCDPAVEIRFQTGFPLGPALRLKGEALTEAAYTPRGGEIFVRVEIVDAQLQSAWSQPFFLDSDWRP